MTVKRRLYVLILLACIVASASPFMHSSAQGATATTISLAVPDYLRDMLTQELVGKFEAENPGVTIELRSSEPDIPEAVNSLTKHLDAVQKYVSSADVVYVDSQILSPESTRAGYYLDLAPLVSEDKAINVDDFWPGMWNAFQWDKGVWGLPTGANVLILSYLPSAFDAANIAYPTGDWTADDLFNAVRKLAQKDADGKVTVHGLDVFRPMQAGLLRVLIGENLFDSSTIPDKPQFTGSNIEKIMTDWVQLEKDGLIGEEVDKAPLSISPLLTLGMFRTGQDAGDNTEKRVGVLLPGNKGGLDVQGYAVSAGTTHPDLAYALAKFLTLRPETSGMFGGNAARKSLVNSNGDSNGPAINVNLSPELSALREKALENGIGLADFRYTDYLLVALQKMQSDGVDAATALQAEEALAVANQQAALEKKAQTTVVVATPIPVQVQSGKAALNFGITSFVNPMPNRDKWDQLAQEFATSDPEIGRVNLKVGFEPLEDSASKLDCFYLPYNGVPSAKLESLLSLDPYLSADSSFDKNDVVGNVMAQLQRDNKTWALPMMIQPSALKYDSQKFDKANIPAPVAGWTLDQFIDALNRLKPESDQPPFVSNGPGGTHLLSLIAAYGGLPLDYRTNPATINFTDPATVTAIRQVLDLARNGYIKYEALGGVGPMTAFGGPPTAPILNQDFDGLRVIRRGGGGEQQEDPYKTTLYPTGKSYNALSYSIGTAYISAKSQNPDACYRWISLLAKHPELFSAMPARRSLINDPALTAAQGADVTALYNNIDKLLADPNTISLPSLFEGGVAPTGFLSQHWLYAAFDSYVLKGGDLDTELKDAEDYVKAFAECTKGIAPYDPSTGQTRDEYSRQYLNCAAKVDPRLKSFVDGLH